MPPVDGGPAARPVARKVGLSLDDVVEAAAAVADADGLEAVTLLSVARRLDVRSPSLYAHVAGLEGLRRELGLFAARVVAAELTEAAAGRRGEDALRAIAGAYRRFAAEHPGLYAAAQRAADPAQDREMYDALLAAIAPVLRALEEAGIESAEERVHLTRVLRSAMHGFVSLEQMGGFGLPTGVEASYRRLVDFFMAAVRAARASHR